LGDELQFGLFVGGFVNAAINVFQDDDGGFNENTEVNRSDRDEIR